MAAAKHWANAIAADGGIVEVGWREDRNWTTLDIDGHWIRLQPGSVDALIQALQNSKDTPRKTVPPEPERYRWADRVPRK